MFTSDAAYDSFMGRYSMRLAPLFADFAGVSAGAHVLDVGAGTGALTAELVRRDATVAAIDPSPQFATTLGDRFPGADTRQGPGESLPWPDATFDVALAQLVVSFMDDAPKGVAEMRRVVRPGGVVAACMWSRPGMDMLDAINRTQAVVTPKDTSADVTRYRTRESFQELLGDNAEIEQLSVDAEYEDFAEFWNALAGGVGPVGVWAASLDDGTREAAREDLRSQLGDPAGRFALTGRAWAARVTRD
jgi:ubiquinone/menaquinone biosynthesis C-methylase UbiE